MSPRSSAPAVSLGSGECAVPEFSLHDQEFVEFRRDLHRHPELGFEERRTSGLVAERLESWGYEVERGVGGTGVAARLRRGSGNRSLGLRADMDALPIQEAGQGPWASQTPGVMHACGHDGHTAMLLSAAKRLATEGGFSGTLNLFFQPAEEVGGARSGAARMIEDGLFDKYAVDAVFAMHVAPGLPQGVLMFRDGPMMAASDRAAITLTGAGGHGAMPHLATDPVVAAASLVMALQTVVSRNIDPQLTAVVSVGVLEAGAANNVIPNSARMELSIRALDAAVRDRLQERICALAEDQARSFGAKADVVYERGYPPLFNAAAETDFARQTAIELLGAERVVAQGPSFTGSEDFAFMLEKRPGSYILIGNGAPGTPGACMVHNPSFDFDDANVAAGSQYWTRLARRYLAG